MTRVSARRQRYMDAACEAAAHQPALTPRGRELAELLRLGHDLGYVAAFWGKSIDTVNSHLHGLRRAYGVHKTSHLIAKLRQEAGLAPLPNSFDPARFTPRENQVVELLLEGLTIRRISAQLGIAYSSVRQYVKNVYAKLGVHSQIELLARLHRDKAATPAPVQQLSDVLPVPTPEVATPLDPLLTLLKSRGLTLIVRNSLWEAHNSVGVVELGRSPAVLLERLEAAP